MFVIKVRDHITEGTRALCSEGGYRLLMKDNNKWCSFVIKYASYEKALAAVEKQLAQSNGNNRFALKRDHRIFEEDGRKLKLLFEHYAD